MSRICFGKNYFHFRLSCPQKFTSADIECQLLVSAKFVFFIRNPGKLTCKCTKKNSVDLFSSLIPVSFEIRFVSHFLDGSARTSKATKNDTD